MARSVSFEPLSPAPQLSITAARVVYEPSVFGGDGSENRKNLVLEVSPLIVTTVQQLESTLDTSRLCSSIKGDTLKCKISMDKVQLFDSKNKAVPPPETWRDLTVNVMAAVKGTWSTRTQTGLSIDVSDVQLLAAKVHQSPFTDCNSP